MSVIKLCEPFGKNYTENEITFSNDTGTVTIFTVTGSVIVRLIPECTTNVASAAAANIKLGRVGDTDMMIVDTLATDLQANRLWLDASPDSEGEPLDAIRSYIITGGNDIVMTLDAQVDSGVLRFYCGWTGLNGGTLVNA